MIMLISVFVVAITVLICISFLPPSQFFDLSPCVDGEEREGENNRGYA